MKLDSTSLIRLETVINGLSANSVPCPDIATCKFIARTVLNAEDNWDIANAARNIALRLCKHDDSERQRMGITLFKEMSKRGDVYSKLTHAQLLWAEGPFKNHIHCLRLVNELLKMRWVEFPAQERAHIALGDLLRQKGLLHFRGQNIQPNPSLALRYLTVAARRYSDGFSAWIVAQSYDENSHAIFRHLAKPNSSEHRRFKALAKELGYLSEEEGDDESEVQQ